ncbi:hypothetical protein SD71_10820 [Cohnella kolymensis]|uniref:Uncharacterized protein n=1 Tax=Cohnella kolymensis TaxID=1590652 RepID=A0ABR5A5N4_9BACL|nr:hypothetical protein [Cohnella kolymensis]KIL35875.1 hypothetical protein SD71_10820 [Cohnella kolymensis]
MNDENSFSQDFKKTITGVLVLLVIGLSVWGITVLLGFNNDHPQVKRTPTQAEIDQWNKERADCQYSDTGCEWDNRWGQ